jgi:hypothetical protein
MQKLIQGLTQRVSGIRFSLTILILGLLKETSWRAQWEWLGQWRSLARAYVTAGKLLPRGPISYQKEWKNIQGDAPVDEMINWLRRAVNMAPKMDGAGFAFTLNTEETLLDLTLEPLWMCQFFLPTQAEMENNLRQRLRQQRFSGEDLHLTFFSGAVFAGKPMRPLPD